MSGIYDLISSQLTEDRVFAMSQSIGADPAQTQQAISAALPTLLGALARNASTPQGEQQLHQALVSDHDGSILDQLGSLFGGATPQTASGVSDRTISGGSILDHILGNRKQRVESGVSQVSGLSSGQAMKLMMMLAPLVMGAIGRRRQQDNLSPGGLGELVRDEQEKAQAQAGATPSLVGRMLDQDGDGDFDMMDIVKFGMSRLFGRR